MLDYSLLPTAARVKNTLLCTTRQAWLMGRRGVETLPTFDEVAKVRWEHFGISRRGWSVTLTRRSRSLWYNGNEARITISFRGRSELGFAARTPAFALRSMLRTVSFMLRCVCFLGNMIHEVYGRKRWSAGNGCSRRRRPFGIWVAPSFHWRWRKYRSCFKYFFSSPRLIADTMILSEGIRSDVVKFIRIGGIGGFRNR